MAQALGPDADELAGLIHRLDARDDKAAEELRFEEAACSATRWPSSGPSGPRPGGRDRPGPGGPEHRRRRRRRRAPDGPPDARRHTGILTQWPIVWWSAVPASTTSRTSPWISPATGWWSSPGSPDRASPRWPSTPSTPRASAATWSRCRPTPASSSARWTSPTWTSSRGCRRPSRSTRSRRRGTPAPRSAPSPRSTTTCACSTPGSACPTARRAGGRWPARRPQQIVDRILELPEGTRFQVLAPVVRGRKGEYGALLDDLARQGFARARIDGDTVELADRDRAGPGPLRAAHHRGRGRPPGQAGTASGGG